MLGNRANPDLSPVGMRNGVWRRRSVCQSFCLSVQMAAISHSAPSAACLKGQALS